jgi:rhodanese-related sulfurtransferase
MERTIKPEDLKEQLSARTDIMLIDVRRSSDVAADPSSIPGAEWRDPEKVAEWSKDLPRDRPFVVYCVRGGSVSNAVLDVLKDKGVTAQYLEGGLAGWKAAGNKTDQ